VDVDFAALEALLVQARDGGPEVPLPLPLPEGGYRTYRLGWSPVMPAGLAERFPGIRALRGRDPQRPHVSVRAELTSRGFLAAISDASRVVLIERSSGSRYLSFVRQVCAASVCQANPPLGFEEINGAPSGGGTGLPGMFPEVEHRTMRLAVATTGEFTAYWGGTVAGGLSGVVQAVNRLNGITERDLALTFELVPDNDRVVFIESRDPFPDPLKPDEKDLAICSGVGAVITAEIGAGNFDLGHLLAVDDRNWGAAGQAGCGTAGACTVSPDPGGDPFWVDYFSHEVGHQFGVQHTHRSCVAYPGGYLDPNGVEPGGGTTVMAYGGICGADNVQARQDAYFHSRSIADIQAMLATPFFACAAPVPTSNRAPLASAGPDLAIPARTPFYLTGQGSDPDGDALTYTWEQADDCDPAPPFGDPESCLPLFRSHPPGPDNRRYFPPLPMLRAGWTTGVPWEDLPRVGRDLGFTLTVRDNHAGAGGVGVDSVAVRVVDGGVPFEVTQPAFQAAWTAGSTRTVKWRVAWTDRPPVSCARVTIKLSTDEGDTFPLVLAASTPNDGSQAVFIPAGATSPPLGAFLWVECTTAPFFAFSRGFTIG
jgi:hypothetical protein